METYSGDPKAGLFNTQDFYPDQGLLQSILQYLSGKPQEPIDIYRTPALRSPHELNNIRNNYSDRPEFQRFMQPRTVNPNLEESILQQNAPSPSFYMYNPQPFTPLRSPPQRRRQYRTVDAGY